MRSSKQRQRNKQNRNNRPSGGNIINRVFDSSGPEGKVRGTPQQIIEKYLQLHRDAQLAGDRVNAENFAQHAEHYTRMLAEAMRDIERAREEQEQFQRDRQQERDRQMEVQREQQRERDQQREREQPRDRDQPREREQFRDRDRDRAPRFRTADEGQPAAPVAAPVDMEPSFLTQPLFPVLVAEAQDDAAPDAGLVETPEERAPRRERTRREPRDGERRPRREASQPVPETAEAVAAPEPAIAAEPVNANVAEPVVEAPAQEAPAAAERPRRPRKPRAPRATAAETTTPDAAE
ncbi:DUF4167 domain-containing protein [Rubellimicrobium arenae]|uniref:DUF4167 domain-containing protein n=1 Tax=Rubellimicrobium arenae TaxID=2817372 RepID=UPI001B310AFC|nr:DUF4167 domain-containing protein [Rubellimicrobium arenae]